MNYKMVMQISGRIIGLEAALMILPLLVSFMYNESIKGFVVAICVAALVSAALILPTRDNDKQIASKEGFTSVSLSWIVISLIGAIPFTLEGEIPNYVDALFETISGLTTTGASILRNVEVMSRGLLFWRSFTHWIGGMGILVLMMAVAPMSDRYSMHLLRAEVPGPTAGKLVPKMRNSSVILYLIYFSLTILEMIVLLFCKMPLYDAAVTAFGTAGTGGFSVKQLSIGAYHSPAVEIAVAVFMMLFGVNFNIYFFLLMKNFKDVLKNEELRVYLGIVLFSTFTIAININGMFHSFSEALRHAFFQVTSISSTTGYSMVSG